MRRKSTIFILTLLFVLMTASSSLAVKVRELPFASDIYLGFVAGIGTGIDFGFRAGYDVAAVKLGVELEQLITDVDYSAGSALT